MSPNLKCLFGIHSWKKVSLGKYAKYWNIKGRQCCKRCGRTEKLVVYDYCGQDTVGPFWEEG